MVQSLGLAGLLPERWENRRSKEPFNPTFYYQTLDEEQKNGLLRLYQMDLDLFGYKAEDYLV